MPSVAPPPRASSAATVAAPPPRSSTPSAAAPPSPSSSSRPDTPSGRPSKPVPTLALPSLLRDLDFLRGTSLLAEFGTPAKDGNDSLEAVRSGSVSAADLDREQAVQLAEAFLAEADSLLAVAATELDSTAKVERATVAGEWADKVACGLQEQ